VVDLRQYGINEPLAQSSLQAGVNLVSFSGDKLLGGPQAGIIAGDAELVMNVRRNPLFRAFRQDKLAYCALETTLRHIVLEEYDCIPALRMVRFTADEIRERAAKLAARLPRESSIEAGQSVIGGGSTPDIALPTFVIALRDENPNQMEQRLRANNPPVIARIEKHRVFLDLRTVFPEEESAILQALS
jgi:L-seryl-tRNA(Ser) seleniumtransferase